MSWLKAICKSGVSLALLALTPSSYACAVCFGNSDAPIVKGVEVSVLFMVGVTYFLIVGGVVSFLLLRRRALRQEKGQTESA